MPIALILAAVVAATAACRAADQLPAALPRARDIHEQRAQPPAAATNKMLGPNLLAVGELVTVGTDGDRPVAIYQGIKTVGYLDAGSQPRTVLEFNRIGGRLWLRLDTMQPDTWIPADAVQLIPDVLIGMRRAQVANRIGKPSRVNRTEDGEEWIYEAYEVLLDRQVIEAREQHRSLVPIVDPKSGTLTIWVPQYYETTKRYTVDNPYWAKVLDKRFLFKGDTLAEIKDLQQAPVAPRHPPLPEK